MSDNPLGRFLRARREAVTPAEVGLPTGDRRRAPGLRRAELATLAGLSVDYLNRLEQGRDRHPSSQVLGALADVLRLSPEQRLHLLHLSKRVAGHGSCGAVVPPARTVRPTVRAMLDRLEPTPALVVNQLGDVVATTSGFRRLAGPSGLLDAEPPNLVRFVLADPRARTAYPDWDRVADQQVAFLAGGLHGDDPHLAALVDELSVTAGAAFTDRLNSPELVASRTGRLRFRHPGVGEVRLEFESLELPAADAQLMVVYLPADAGAAAALARLTAAGELVPA